MVAYGLIALMIAAAVAGVLYLYHNTHQKRYKRQRLRDKQDQED